MAIEEKDLTAAELKSILEHKYYMSLETGKEISIEEAIEDFIKNYKADWEVEKLKRENLEQLKEIEKYKWIRSQQEGHDIGNTATEEWIQKYAHMWREEKNSLEKNEFIHIKVKVQNKEGLHVRPSSTLVKIASTFDCEVYVHKENMDHYNFILNGKRYANVKSIVNILNLAATQGEELEFIAMGNQAKESLDAIEDFVNKKNVDQCK